MALSLDFLLFIYTLLNAHLLELTRRHIIRCCSALDPFTQMNTYFMLDFVLDIICVQLLYMYMGFLLYICRLIGDGGIAVAFAITPFATAWILS